MMQLSRILHLNPSHRQLLAIFPLIALLTAVGLPPVHAVGLGEIQVHSYLNDPLAATVDLTLSPSEEVEHSCIRVVEPSGGSGHAGDMPYLQNAELTLVKNGGTALLELATRRAVVDPILTILLQVDCPGTGRFVREYTVLLGIYILDSPLIQS